MGKVKLDGYECERCSHKWVGRIYDNHEKSGEEPKVCPKCKSPYWNIPRKSSRGKILKRSSGKKR